MTLTRPRHTAPRVLPHPCPAAPSRSARGRQLFREVILPQSPTLERGADPAPGGPPDSRLTRPLLRRRLAIGSFAPLSLRETLKVQLVLPQDFFLVGRVPSPFQESDKLRFGAAPLPDAGCQLLTGSPRSQQGVLRLIGWPTRVVAVAGAVAAITALMMRPAPDAATSPSHRPSEPSMTSRTRSHHGAAPPKPMRDRAAAKRVHRARRSAAPKRAPHRRSAPRLAGPPAVPAAPAAPSPQNPAPWLPPRQTGPQPKRVPAGAPPEFM
jgi:hypothetical protein